MVKKTIPSVFFNVVGASLFTLLPVVALAQQASVPFNTEFEVEADAELQTLLPETTRSAGVLALGSNPSSPPFGFYGEDGRSIEGREIDVMSAVTRKLGLEPQWYDVGGFDNLIPGLTTGRYDAVLSNMHVTAERLERIDFVSFFNTNQLGLVVQAGSLDEPYTDFAQLCGKTVAAGSGTTNAFMLEDASERCVVEGLEPIEIPLFPDRASGVQSVISGRSPAFFGPYEGLAYEAAATNGRLEIGGTFEVPANQVGIGLPKDSPLTEPVRQAVNALIEDGTYAQILTKWNIEHGAITEARANRDILDE
ncbi:ABC transporter substrate-binding protein [Vreelandella nigrificans]|uniref:ABC transporter substrate-binding protein n=1 Tax=Vreelandella nigrificans TaxID=2042704 RepID=A0A2A4HN00_9GAMM|nr:ABC transporter substrate-binding protein [Halomonas nigrificans]PCF95575.1 ABC transporter substrate-binding protein [Halomonas nigrificans]